MREEPQQELIRRLREQAWSEGFDACRRGEPRRNPYRAVTAEATR